MVDSFKILTSVFSRTASWTIQAYLDEHSLVFSRFSEGSARERERRARREKRRRQPEKKKERLSFFVPLPSRAFSHARAHLHILRVLLDGSEKKERLLVVYLYWVKNSFFCCFIVFVFSFFIFLF